MNRQGWAWALQALLGLAYPFLVWTGLSRFEPRSVGLFVLAFFVLRLALQQPGRLRVALHSFARPALVIGLIMAAVIGWNDARGLLLLPVAISLGFLATFLGSLRSGPPMIERFARLQVDTLYSAEVAYCRRVTWVWCGFFVANASLAGALALWGSTRNWALYTGFLSYIAMGTLFAAEYIYRHARFRRYEGGFADGLLKRVFPPRNAAPNPDPRGIDTAWAPTLRSRQTGALRWEAEWEVPEGLDCFAGHFPEQALLPGVVQLEWLAREIEGETQDRFPGRDAPIRFSRIERLKFKRPIFPGDHLTACFERDADTDTDTAAIKTTLRVRGELATTATWIAGAAHPPAPAEVREAVALEAGEAGPLAIESLLPHRPPMLWLEGIDRFDADSARCLARAASLHAGLGAGGEVGGWAAIEWMAQAVAAHDGARRSLAGQPIRPGMLLGTPRLELAADAFQLEEAFWIDVRRVLGDDESSMVVYEASVQRTSDGQPRAAARISCRIGSPGEPLVPD